MEHLFTLGIGIILGVFIFFCFIAEHCFDDDDPDMENF